MSAAANGGFDRERLPSWPEYADRSGLTLIGRGRWRTTRCEFHDDNDPSLRVNVESGGWVCMSCRTKGGDVLSHHMQRTGEDFAQAARSLGAWVERGGTRAASPHRLSARDALSAVGLELGVCMIVISDARRGILPNDADWSRFLRAASRVEFIAAEAVA